MIDHVWISITPKGEGPPPNFLQLVNSAMTSMRGFRKTPDALHRFFVGSPWKRRAVYVRAHYKGEHVWLSIAPKRKAPPAIFLQGLYTPMSTIRSFHERPEISHLFWVGSPRKREIHQKSHSRQSLEKSKIFWGSKFNNPSQPPCATVIPLRKCKNAGRYYATPGPCDCFSGSA